MKILRKWFEKVMNYNARRTELGDGADLGVIAFMRIEYPKQLNPDALMRSRDYLAGGGPCLSL